MNPTMETKLSDLREVFQLIISAQETATGVISLYKLLTLDLSPCLTKFILNVFSNSLNDKNCSDILKVSLKMELVDNKYEVIAINTFIHSLPDVRYDLLKLMFEIHTKLKINFSNFQKMIKNCLLPQKMFYATYKESKAYLDEIERVQMEEKKKKLAQEKKKNDVLRMSSVVTSKLIGNKNKLELKNIQSQKIENEKNINEENDIFAIKEVEEKEIDINENHDENKEEKKDEIPEENKEEKLEERKGIIVIGMISSGKSTFLNSLLGINYLETKDDITTKFICIIRYNNEINEPKFCHLKIKEEEKGKYYFIKDGEESIGKDKIIEKISNINLKESSITQPQYDQLFYLLETNITNIENKDFLKKHDFYDIPGLNEYMITDEKSEKDQKDKPINKDEQIKTKIESIEYGQIDLKQFGNEIGELINNTNLNSFKQNTTTTTTKTTGSLSGIDRTDEIAPPPSSINTD
jgi:hypothetical protein